LKDVSGVGISFGADRIYDVMLQLDLFPQNSAATTQVLFTNFGEAEELYSLKLVQKIREAGINAELFPESSKMKKQMNYADKKGVPFVAIVGEDEIQQQKITLKNMTSGEQQLVAIDELIRLVKAID
jgi:histidyl-tRNA synthetase